MELFPSRESTSCAVTKEFSNILWNRKVHYSVHKSPPLVLVLIQINPVHIIQSYLRSILIVSTCLRLGLPSGPFHSGSHTNILYAFLSSPIRDSCPGDLILRDIILIIRRSIHNFRDWCCFWSKTNFPLHLPSFFRFRIVWSLPRSPSHPFRDFHKA
jgi:hypothetical protein